jgi:hypothetical protein
MDTLFIAKPRGYGVLNETILARVETQPEQPEVPVCTANLRFVKFQYV